VVDEHPKGALLQQMLSLSNNKAIFVPQGNFFSSSSSESNCRNEHVPRTYYNTDTQNRHIHSIFQLNNFTPIATSLECVKTIAKWRRQISYALLSTTQITPIKWRHHFFKNGYNFRKGLKGLSS
jgi:hypothetical protein